MTRVVIVSARRTPFGRFGGRLAKHSPVQLATIAADAALSSLNRELIDQVILGSVLAAGHGMNIARQVAIHAGLPESTPAWTVNMMCGSGLQTALLGAQAIRAGDARAVLVGGVESMSQAALLLPRPRKGQTANADQAVDSLQVDGLVDSFSRRHMAETAEDLAADLQITREAQDAYAERSQQRYAEAQRAGQFADEIIPLDELNCDEHPRPEATREILSQLKPIFRSAGTVTAGNASGINDGAAMVVLAESDFARQQGWPVLAEWIAGTVVGCDPQRMGLGPVYAVQKLLIQTGRRLGDLDVLEFNEAFAAQVLACTTELDLHVDLTADNSAGSVISTATPQLNPHGGAIAVGHPLAASGARLLAHLSWQIHQGHAGESMAALCIGGGMGIAALLGPAA